MSYGPIKRLLDILGASIGLAVLTPAGLLIAFLIKLSDRGPVFYTQTRIGQFARPFRIWKFRSMVADADKIGAPLTKGDDPRITRVGRFLRGSKLDELPQLWNVLRGEMSLVGPRPEVPRYVECYTSEQRQVLECKPGITDLASLCFSNEESLLRGAPDPEAFYLRYCLPKKLELNRQYAQQASLALDFWIIFQTLRRSWLNGGDGNHRRWRQRDSQEPLAGPVRQVAIIGTGERASSLIADFARRTTPPRRVVALFDDDPHTWHQRLHGVPVVGMPECLLNREWRLNVDEILVTLPEGSVRMEEIMEMVKGLPMKVTVASAPATKDPES